MTLTDRRAGRRTQNTAGRAGETDAPLLQIEDLVVAFGDVRAVERVSLTIDSGDIFALAGESGGEIDGAWWPRVDRMTVELPGLIQALTPSLGDITSINVNWSHLQRPPDLNWPGWECRPARTPPS